MEPHRDAARTEHVVLVANLELVKI